MPKGYPAEFTKEYLEERYVPEPNSGCWLWLGSLSCGYGHLSAGGRLYPAHRFAWLIHRGTIPAGLTLDHLCRTRICVNPQHLEPVTRGENCLRGVGACAKNAKKTRCKRGHLFDTTNTYTLPNRGPNRVCRKCVNQAQKDYQKRKAAKEIAS